MEAENTALRLENAALKAENAALKLENAELKARLQVSDGNLSVHLRKLEEAGYVAVEKTYAGRKPLTRVRLADKGRDAFDQYLAAMGRLVATG